MNVGIIGTNWGRVHAGTFRDHDCVIAGIVGRNLEKTRTVASEECIPLASTDPTDLSDMDIIVIASPLETHIPYLEMFHGKPVLCEKPLLGGKVEPGFLEEFADKPVFVNYAFSFLDTARVIRENIDSLGEVFRVSLRCSAFFPFDFEPAEFLEGIVSHELAFLSWCFEPFTIRQFYNESDRTNISLVMTNCHNQVLTIDFMEAHRESINLDLRMYGTSGDLHVEGGYIPGKMWNFTPVKVNGDCVNDGEYSTDCDIWFRANSRLCRLFLDVLEGKCSRKDALDRGLMDISRAAAMEEGLLPLLKK
jgi:myo-inositol 2-dehydrogenase/D-chiro-inositol 1-dehydrogenase